MDKVFYVPNMAGADTSRYPSIDIWKDVNALDYALDTSKGFHYFSDFINWPQVTPATTNTVDGWYVFLSAASTAAGLSTERTGVAKLATPATDALAAHICLGPGGPAGGTGGVALVTPGGGGMTFEARVRVSSAALGEGVYFIGLAEPASAVVAGIYTATPDTDIDTCLTDNVSLIGWANHTDAAPVLEPIYNKTTASSAGSTTHTIVLNSWVKLGLKFNPLDDTLKWFVNGVEVRSIDVSDAGTTTFPGAATDYLLPTIAVKTGDAGGAAKSIDVDWVRFAQSWVA